MFKSIPVFVIAIFLTLAINPQAKAVNFYINTDSTAIFGSGIGVQLQSPKNNNGYLMSVVQSSIPSATNGNSLLDVILDPFSMRYDPTPAILGGVRHYLETYNQGAFLSLELGAHFVGTTEIYGLSRLGAGYEYRFGKDFSLLGEFAISTKSQQGSNIGVIFAINY